MRFHLSPKNEVVLQVSITSEDHRETLFSGFFHESLDIGKNGSPLLSDGESRAFLKIILDHIDHNNCRLHSLSSSHSFSSSLYETIWLSQSAPRSQKENLRNTLFDLPQANQKDLLSVSSVLSVRSDPSVFNLKTRIAFSVVASATFSKGTFLISAIFWAVNRT